MSWATPGGPTDLLSRALADAAPPHFDGQRVNVMTRQSGAGAAGMQYMQGRAGYPHVLGVFTASGTVNMATGRIPFGPEDFTPILRLIVGPRHDLLFAEFPMTTPPTPLFRSILDRRHGQASSD